MNAASPHDVERIPPAHEDKMANFLRRLCHELAGSDRARSASLSVIQTSSHLITSRVERVGVVTGERPSLLREGVVSRTQPLHESAWDQYLETRTLLTGALLSRG